MSDKATSFVKAMVARFPNLSVLLEEHIKDNDEILPHVFLGDVTRHVVSLTLAVTRGDSSQGVELRQILAYLENAYGAGGDEIVELIAASFLENLPWPDERGAEVRDMVRPNLKRQLDAIG